MAWAAPLIRFATAPALAIAAWRLAFSALFIGLVLLLRPGDDRRPKLSHREWGLTLLAGGREWGGIALAVAGAVVVGWGDLALGGRALLGDALALGGGVLMAVYLIVGRSLRPKMDLWRYTGLVYGTAAVLLVLAVLSHPAVDLTGYPRTDWLLFLALAAGPMMLGHTGMNYAVRYVPAYAVTLAALAEPIGSTVIAWLLPAIAEIPSPRTLFGGAAILIGIVVGLWPSASGEGGSEATGGP
jgi:drug/metabolite transporter (DMT)-like permease